MTGGYAISGAFDLLPLLNVSENADWRLDAASARALSPIHLPPPAVFDAVVGERESSEFRRQSRALSDAWGARYEEIAGANHFTVLDGLCDPASAMVARIVEIWWWSGAPGELTLRQAQGEGRCGVRGVQTVQGLRGIPSS